VPRSIFWNSFIALALLMTQSCSNLSTKKISSEHKVLQGSYEINSPDAKIYNGQVIWVRTSKDDLSCHLAATSAQVIRAHDGSWGCLLPIPFRTTLGSKEVVVRRQEQVEESVSIVISEGDYPREKISVDGKYVEPPKKVLKRIQQETKLLAEVYKKLWEPEQVDLNFRLPVNSDVTSKYGNRRFYNNIEKNFHSGTDFRAKTGTKIYSPATARVELSQDLYFTGGTVILNHGYGIFTVYAHMSKVLAEVGKTVGAGDLLGLAGATGRVSGPHLHWGMNINGEKVDPMSFMRLFNPNTKKN